MADVGVEARVVSVWQRKPTCTYQQGEQAEHFLRYPTPLRLSVNEEGLEGSLEWARQSKPKQKDWTERSILVNCESHYRDLARQFPEQPWEARLGEQLVVSGLSADTICVGDVYGFSESPLELQVSFPRHPCARVDKRYPVTPARPTGQPGTCRQWMAANGRGGFFCKVNCPGDIAGGDQIKLLKRPCPMWTLSRLSAMFYSVTPLRVSWTGSDDELVELCNLPELGYHEWRERLIVVKAALARQRPLKVPEWLGRPMTREEGLDELEGEWSIGGCGGDKTVKISIEGDEIRSMEPIFGNTFFEGMSSKAEGADSEDFSMKVQMGFPMTATMNRAACKLLLLFSSGAVWMKIDGLSPCNFSDSGETSSLQDFHNELCGKSDASTEEDIGH